MADNEKDIKIEHDLSLEDEVENPMESFFYNQRRALEETGKALEALLPPDFRNHAGEASKEFAQGFRILVDVAIDELKSRVLLAAKTLSLITPEEFDTTLVSSGSHELIEINAKLLDAKTLNDPERLVEIIRNMGVK